MRPQLEFGVTAALLLAVLLGVALLGSRQRQEPSFDPRRSTYLPGPGGGRGFADALGRLGVQVVRLRQRLPMLDPAALADSGTVLAAIGPTLGLDAADAAVLAELAEVGLDLLLAGSSADLGIRCFGYTVEPRFRTLAAAAAERPTEYALRINAVLADAPHRPGRDPRTPADARSAGCEPPGVVRVDTLLRTESGEPGALRLELAGARRVTLVADDALFANRSLRSTSAGPFALRLVAGRYRRLLVDEYDHGFGPSGRLDQAAIGWIRRTPWGWAGLQLAGVGLLLLLTSGARFGPVRRVIERRRRSPLEHVRALATALAAARGHQLAVRLLVRGLQRRLAPGNPAGGPADRLDPAAWLAAAAPRLRTSAGRAAADRLLGMMQHPVTTAGVLDAAELVETIWSDLTSASRPAMSSARRA